MSHNQARTAILMVYAAFGAVVGIWAGSIPQVVAASGFGSFGQGLGLTISTLAGVLAMAASGAIGRRTSNRTAILALIPILWLSTMALLLTSGPVQFYLSLVVFGAALGLLDVFMNAEASFVEHQLGRPIFTSFHASVSMGVAVFAIVGSWLSTNYGSLAASLSALPVMALAFFLVRSNLGKHPPLLVRPSGLPPRKAVPALSVIGLAAGLIIAAETAAIFWSARLLNEQAPSFAQFAGLGVSFYALCNSTIRFFGDRLRARFGEIQLMLVSLSFGVVAFAALGFSGQFGTSVVAFAAIGCSMAILVPCLLNLSAQQTPHNRAAGLGYAFGLAGPARVGAPWLFGWIAAGFSTSIAFGMCAVIVLAALVLVATLPRFLRDTTG